MAMEWKLIDESVKDGFGCIVGRRMYYNKAHFVGGQWIDSSNCPLKFEPTHYMKVEYAPEVIDLKIGDYVRNIKDGIVLKVWDRGFLANFIEAIEKGTYEIVEVTKKNTD